MRRTILDALESDSDAEFHRILKRLPVRTAEARGVRAGVSGYYRTYSIRGTEDATLFVADIRAHTQLGEVGYDYSMTEDGGERVSGPRADFSAASAYYDCSTMWDGVEYVGECATQQEIDDAIAVIAAMDAEITADYSEAEASCLQLNCQYDQEEDLSAGAEGVERSIVFASYPATKSTVAFFPSLEDVDGVTCDNVDVGTAAHDGQYVESPPIGCAGEGIAAAAGVAGWIFSKMSAYDVMVRGASRLGMVAVVGGTIVAGFSAGYGVGSWLSCMAQ